MDLNTELYRLYYDFDQDIYETVKEKNNDILNEKDKLVYPLFIRSTKEYDEADIKLMIFGKETNGWIGIFGDDDKKYVDDILDSYEDFFSTKWCYNHNGQFWYVVKYFIGLLKKKNKDKNVEYLWNNLVKLGKNGIGFPNKGYENIVKPYFNELIPKEINIVKPDFIIFFSGPNSINGPYDTVLDEVFNNPKRKLVGNFKISELCEIEIPVVRKAFRTYHPTFLLHNNKKRSYKEYIKKLVDEITNNI
jgi:hypothetical protein